MKSLKYILVILLAFVVFVLGAGTGVVHVCSVYCKTQACSSSLHVCNEHKSEGDKCCHSDSDESEDTKPGLSEHCSCLNVAYSIDFFKISQDDDAVAYTPVIIDILEFFSFNIFKSTENHFCNKAINAPPIANDGRKLLALNSILII